MSKVSVGLMVYNEADYVYQTIQSIQAQSFCDYELIIGDNASTDGSSEIIAKLAAQDSRIIHIKRSRNIGALQNWNDIVRHSRGKYFVLAGAHDLWSPDYLKSLVSVLDARNDAVLAFCKTQWIDDAGHEIHVPTSILDTSGMSPLGRFVSLMFTNQHYLYGMIRTQTMQETRLQKEIIGSGEIFLQELAQLGNFVLVEGQRWYRRKNRTENGALDRLERYSRMLLSSPGSRVRFRFFPHMQMMLQYFLLPFEIKGISANWRIAMLFSFPLIVVRFAKRFLTDIRWLIKGK